MIGEERLPSSAQAEVLGWLERPTAELQIWFGSPREPSRILVRSVAGPGEKLQAVTAGCRYSTLQVLSDRSWISHLNRGDWRYSTYEISEAGRAALESYRKAQSLRKTVGVGGGVKGE